MAALKGAFLNFGAGLLGKLPNVIVFQFNPDKVSRTPSLPRRPTATAGAGPSRGQTQPGPPAEEMSFTLRLDATDSRAALNPVAVTSGVLPTLSALELLMVPSGGLSLDLFALGGGPKPHTHPPEKLPTVLFFWGPFRILPVALTSLRVDETHYDPALTPVRAEVAVSLQVLTPDKLDKDDGFARGAFKYTQGVKEVMAALNLANAAELGLGAALSFSV